MVRLADRLIQKYEKGDCRIGAGRLYILARSLNVPIQYFFEEVDDWPAKLEKRPSVTLDAEVREFTEAFLSIPDESTRRSFVDLVLSLADRRPG